MDIHRLEEMGPITYGKVPDGFVQWVPKEGEPAPIFEGGLFYFELRAKDGRPGVSGLFILRDGKIISELNEKD